MVTASKKPLYDPCGGVLCLDLVNTVDRSPTGADHDTLAGFADLIRWSLEAGTLTPAALARLEQQGAANAGAARVVFERATKFREASYRVFDAVRRGLRSHSADLDAINVELAAASANARIGSVPGGFEWGWDPTSRALDAPLWPIVRSAGELLTSPDRELIKECGAQGCLWLFVDRSKNHGRRWCEMKTCGNRAKVREHRRRKRDVTGT